MNHFLKFPTVQLNLDLDCSLIISLILYAFSWRKILISFALWQNALSSRKIDLIIKQIFYQWDEKLLRISMYTHALIVEIKIAIFLGHLSNMQSHIMNDGKFTNFLQAVIFVSFKQHQIKVPALANADSWFITKYHCSHTIIVWGVFCPLKSYILVCMLVLVSVWLFSL